MLTTDFGFFDDSKRSLAKLMAKENITVQIIAGAETASFDMVARVLTIPAWPGLSVNQIDLLVGHETGHALFTDPAYIKSMVEARKKKLHPGLMSYFNVVEDARIERKQREAYPGLKASFYDGYRDFADRGPIFKTRGTKVDGKPVAEMSLIDRINVFYKLGAFVTVPFSKTERPWIAEIDKAWSTERALEIARQLHELAKDDILEEQKRQQEQQKNQPQGERPEQGEPQSGESGESDDQSGADADSGEEKKPAKGKSKDSEPKDDKDSKDASGSGDSSDDAKDEKKDGKPSGSDESKDAAKKDGSEKSDDASGTSSGDTEGDTKVDAPKPAAKKKPLTKEEQAQRDALDPESKTDKALAEVLKKLAAEQPKQENQIRHLLLKPLDDATVRDRTITPEDWCDAVHTALFRSNAANGKLTATLVALEKKWNDQYLSTAENMAQEFLRKKVAKNLMHAKTGKSGRLDMTKLAKFKFADDLFKTITTVPNGQSHGIVMIIDGSSSMNKVFGAVLDQVLLFGHFAFKANIPFECYMFTNANDSSHRVNCVSAGLQTITLPAAGSLVGLMNTGHRASFRRQVQAVLAFRHKFVHDFSADADLTSIPYGQLSATPLYAGMMIAERHVARMKRTLRLDKVMTVVISDGQDNKGLVYETQDVDGYGRIIKHFETLGSSAIVVRDTVTKKNHVFVGTHTEYGKYGGPVKESYVLPENAIMTMLFDVMKSRHDCRNIFIYLTTEVSRDERKYGYTPHAACKYLLRSGVAFAVRGNDVRKAMDEQHQFVMPAEQSITDCAMVVRPAALQLSENTFSSWAARGASQKTVATEFVKASSKAVANRVFVNTVIPHLI